MEEEPSVAQLSPPACLWGFSWWMVTVGSAAPSLRLYKKTSWAGMGSQPVSSVYHGFCFSSCSDFPSCWLSLRWINPFLIHVAFRHGVYHSSRNLKTVDKLNSSCGRKEDSWDRKVKRCLALSSPVGGARTFFLYLSIYLTFSVFVKPHFTTPVHTFLGLCPSERGFHLLRQGGDPVGQYPHSQWVESVRAELREALKQNTGELWSKIPDGCPPGWLNKK